MAELTYRDAVARGIAQEMMRDPDVIFFGEDVAKAGGVFKTTVGLHEQFGDKRVRDCPISEQAILGAAMGAAMTGLKPIAEIMFSDFFAVCFDYIANQFSKSRYMSNGQLKCPLVVRTANGAGSRFGAQHSQSVENWAMMIPGLKVVAPSSPRDVIGLLAAAVRDPDPVIFFEHKSLYPTKGEVPEGEIVDRLGASKVVRPGKDATILPLALMVPRALEAANMLATEHGIVYQMKKRWPDKEFIVADGCIGCRMHCPYMKMIDLVMVRDALRRGKHEIHVPQDVADGARRALERMIAVPRDA